MIKRALRMEYERLQNEEINELLALRTAVQHMGRELRALKARIDMELAKREF